MDFHFGFDPNLTPLRQVQPSDLKRAPYSHSLNLMTAAMAMVGIAAVVVGQNNVADTKVAIAY